jgi:hypothetical protein
MFLRSVIVLTMPPFAADASALVGVRIERAACTRPNRVGSNGTFPPSA